MTDQKTEVDGIIQAATQLRDAVANGGDVQAATSSLNAVLGSVGATSVTLTPRTPERGMETRKARHALLRKLERADWALKEDDSDDAMAAVFAAVRLMRKHDLIWEEELSELPALLGRAVTVVLEDVLTSEGVGAIVSQAAKMLIREGETYRGCDYGM